MIAQLSFSGYSNILASWFSARKGWPLGGVGDRAPRGALKKLRLPGQGRNLLITDLNMPGMTWDRAYRRFSKLPAYKFISG
jgi:hypothetical protein